MRFIPMAALEKHGNVRVVLAIATLFLSGGFLTGGKGAIAQELPDSETYEYLRQKYSVLLRQDRSACGYYIDPTDVYQSGDIRVLMVKISRGPEGSGCKGVLAFQLLQVNCKTEEVVYNAPTDSVPVTWRINRYLDSAVAQKICTLPDPHPMPAVQSRIQ